ncbi:MAG: cytochrome c3 family protein [Deltaproteobacteria bacterium]|nr:cytochrome c3 family protein [Deltaproteobacteria bacterium]
MRLIRFLLLFITFFIAYSLFSPEISKATNAYAVKTGKGCIFCHKESTGGQLKTVGFAYIRNGYTYPISESTLKKAEALQTPFYKFVRFIMGYIHLLAAVIFFGAIFYIHIFVKPTKIVGGIPKAERLLGISCMIILTITGTYLTWMRIDRWEDFFNNTFGLMLFVKILLFGLMVAIALIAITVIHRKMRREGSVPQGSETVSKDNLKAFNGTDGGPAYFAYEKKAYDVTKSEKWKDGRHFGKHVAGSDLTDAIKDAPHGTEVLERIKCLGELEGGDSAQAEPSRARRFFVVMAYTNLVIIFLILVCISIWRWDFPLRLISEKRVDVIAGKTCMECHKVKTPGIYSDWKGSVHASVDVTCNKCHRPNNDSSVLQSHLKHYPLPISVVVSPVNCSGCHPKEAEQYVKSKHANTQEIMWKVDYWLNDGMNNSVERTTGCYACHGTVVKVADGKPVEGTWPNVGVGRINPDGSKGSCSSCHTRHRFSLAEARKPEACDQCHLGPDHPQIEIYNESKHGTIYHAEGYSWNWSPKDHQWKANRDFRAPTCATCHMSAAKEVPKTHDVTERLSWEIQAPLTVRPSEFKPFPAATNWQEERVKMKKVCLQCHGTTWTEDHFKNFDNVVDNYNEIYYKPVKSVIDKLYADGLLSKKKYFDEALEWEFYEFWHHEGRRARMGAAMMAPDYAWWHGFYEMKHRFNKILKMSEDLKKGKSSVIYKNFPGMYETDHSAGEKQ